jgi:putative ATPase
LLDCCKMNSLFNNNYREPLAHELRPKTLEELVGQKKAIHFISRLTKPSSLLLYGPPGSGKTTIALVLGELWKKSFFHISAISSGVKEVREILSIADNKPGLVLFLDEIHRFTSSQQDSLLEAVEKGKVILIGATTENPGFRINRALLSRLTTIQLEPLSEDDLRVIANKAIQKVEPALNIDLISIDYLVKFSGGDARKLLTSIESVRNSSDRSSPSLEDIQKLLLDTVPVYDRTGENHYDYISAFIKSVRGSDPDAAIFYLACMLEAGEDPLFITRRLVILASEDIGNSTPGALSVAVAGVRALETIGMPEGRIILAQITTYLATCPKSNAAYTALDKAIAYIKQHGPLFLIPIHLRNAPTYIHKKEGNGKGYKYPHDFGGFVQENYFPTEVEPPQFYFPTENGQEKTIKERLISLWKGWNKKKY